MNAPAVFYRNSCGFTVVALALLCWAILTVPACAPATAVPRPPADTATTAWDSALKGLRTPQFTYEDSVQADIKRRDDWSERELMAHCSSASPPFVWVEPWAGKFVAAAGPAGRTLAVMELANPKADAGRLAAASLGLLGRKEPAARDAIEVLLGADQPIQLAFCALTYLEPKDANDILHRVYASHRAKAKPSMPPDLLELWGVVGDQAALRAIQALAADVTAAPETRGLAVAAAGQLQQLLKLPKQVRPERLRQELVLWRAAVSIPRVDIDVDSNIGLAASALLFHEPKLDLSMLRAHAKQVEGPSVNVVHMAMIAQDLLGRLAPAQ